MDDEPDSTPPGSGQRRGRRRVSTIRDVAQLAGVDPSTVSRALREPGRMSAETERIVREAAEKLNYQANPAARALHTGRTNTVAMIVGDLTSPPVFFEIVSGAQRAAQETGYTFAYAGCHEAGEDELAIAEQHIPTADGILLIMSSLTDEQVMMLAKRIPVVLVNRLVHTIPSIVPDIDHGVGEAVRHLADLGHRSIAYVAVPARPWLSAHRWECLLRHCESANISLLKIDADAATNLGGRHVTATVRESGVTAVIAFNDLVAVGLMRALNKAGVSVPADISVIGFDDSIGTTFAWPPLTTVTAPQAEIGVRAFNALLAQIRPDAPTYPTMPAPLLTTLIVRESTGRPADGGALHD